MVNSNSKQVAGVYQLSFPDGSLYIGGSKNIVVRIQTHLSWLRKGNGQTYKLQAKYDEFGKPEQKVLLICEPKNIGMYESLIYDFIKPELCKKQYGGTAGLSFSEESRKNMSEAAKKKDQRCQSKRQLETWRDPEIKARRNEGTKLYWEGVRNGKISRPKTDSR